jgi:hypothetical protein
MQEYTLNITDIWEGGNMAGVYKETFRNGPASFFLRTEGKSSRKMRKSIMIGLLEE